jgi:hypothetical protein
LFAEVEDGVLVEGVAEGGGGLGVEGVAELEAVDAGGDCRG